MGRGRSFQREGAAAEKAPVTPGPALSPDGFKSVCAGGPEATGRGMEGEEVRKVGRGQVI